LFLPIDIAEAYNSLRQQTKNVTEFELCYNTTSGVEVCIVTNTTITDASGQPPPPPPGGEYPISDDPYAPTSGGGNFWNDDGGGKGPTPAPSPRVLHEAPSVMLVSSGRSGARQLGEYDINAAAVQPGGRWRAAAAADDLALTAVAAPAPRVAGYGAATWALLSHASAGVAQGVAEAYSAVAVEGRLNWDVLSGRYAARLASEQSRGGPAVPLLLHANPGPGSGDAFAAVGEYAPAQPRLLQATHSPSPRPSALPSSVPSPLPGNGSSLIPANATGNATAETNWELVTEEVQIRNGPLETLWKLVYWVTFLLTYIIIPVVQEYINAGEFTRCGRLKTSLRVNVVFYAVCGVFVVGALGYVILGQGYDMYQLAPTLISLANTYGLVLIVLLMGYGAAEVPKGIWRRSNPAAELRRVRFKAPEVEANLFDARTNLEQVVDRVRQLNKEVSAMAGDPDHKAGGAHAAEYAKLRQCTDLVMSKCAAELAENRYAASNAAADAEDAKLKAKAAKRKWSKLQTLMSQLAYTHKLLMIAKRRLARYSFRWRRHVLYAIQLEYVVDKAMPPTLQTASGRGGAAAAFWDGRAAAAGEAAHAEGDAAGGSSALGGAAAATYGALACLPNLAGGAVNRALWYYRIHLAPYADKVLALVAEALSLLLMWSEATIWVNLSGLSSTNLSVFGQLLRAVSDAGLHEYFTIQVVAAIPLAWMCICSTFAVFRIKFLDILDLSPHRNTDPYALCINAALFNRLQFSLTFNYLNVLMHSNNKADFPDTAFSHSVGAGMKLSVIDWYLPLIMPLIYAMCRVDLWDRFMRLLGIEERGTPIAGNAAHDELIADGTKLIAKARRSLGLDEAAAGSGMQTPLSEDGVIRRKGRPSESPLAGGHRGGGDVEMAAAHRKGFMSLDAFSAAPGGGAGASRLAVSGVGEAHSYSSSPSSVGERGAGSGLLAGGKGGAPPSAPSFFGSLNSIGSSIGGTVGGMGAALGFGGPAAGSAAAGSAGGRGGPGGQRGGAGASAADEAYIANPWGTSSGISGSGAGGGGSGAPSWSASSFAPPSAPSAASSSSFSAGSAASYGGGGRGAAGAGAASGSFASPAPAARPGGSLAAFAAAPTPGTATPGKGGASLAALLKGGKPGPGSASRL